ncbi:MAG: sensor histidine kinase, partial [Phycisphaeraceae bacterium]
LILNPKHDYAVLPEKQGAWSDRETIWRTAKEDTSLLYSETMVLPIRDINGQWFIWSGRYDADFWSQSSIQSLNHLALIRQVGLAVIIGAMMVIWILICRAQRVLISKNDELEQRVQKQTADLLQVSRQAGMAEIATGVLHNVGNVLNSVNLSADMIANTVNGSRLTSLGKLADLLSEEKHQLGAFVTDDPRGSCIPDFLEKIHETLSDEQGKVQDELEQLVTGVEHIKEIVRLQQVSATTTSNVASLIDPVELMNQAVTINLIAMERHAIVLERDYEPNLPKVTIEKHKTLQILINLLNNAKKATCHTSIDERRITLQIRYLRDEGIILFEVTDNGMGIDPDNLAQLFQHGFSKFEDGHGFGLHSGACAATEMNGSLTAESGGVGAGATFRLSLPANQLTPGTNPEAVSQ